MSLGFQMRSLQRGVATFRSDMFGRSEADKPITFDYDNGGDPAVPAYYSPIRYRQFTDESGGFLSIRACAVRVIKALAPSFKPEIDKLIRITEGETEFVLRIDDIAGTHPLSVEWILGCKEQN